MIFLSLLMDLMLLFGFGGSNLALTPDAVGQHTIHGHLPGPPTHSGTSHLHHGQHGHSVGPSGHEPAPTH